MSAWADLKATFEVGQGSRDLFAKMRIYPHFSGKPRNLFAKMFIGWDASADLYAKFTVQATKNLFCKFTVRHSSSRDLYVRFRLYIHFNEGWGDVKAEFLLARSGSADLFSEFAIRQIWSEDLKGILTVRHPDSADLPAEGIIRHSASTDLKGIFIVRHTADQGLKGITVIRHTGIPLEIFAKMEIIPVADLKAIFSIRHSTSQDLHGYFYVRHPYWLWTTRRYINGVVDAAESLIGDAKLEYVIEGVMEDIQGILEANRIVYDDWTNITLVPTLIRRATTYGAVAALYSRHSRTFRSRVIPSAAPVTVTTIGDDERAMKHWEDKMQQALDNYLATQLSAKLWVSTADEEPIFSMADIPPSADEAVEWHEWLQQRVD